MAKAQLHAECISCSWLRHCFGGCFKDRIKSPKDEGKPRFCISYKMLFEYADKRLKQIAEIWKHKKLEYLKESRTGQTYDAYYNFVKKTAS